MKITLLTLFLSFISLTVQQSYSQTTTVSIHKGLSSVKDVIDEIEKQTDYLFVYDKNEINLTSINTLAVDNIPLNDALQKVFSRTGISYNVNGKNISLSKREQVNQTLKQEERKITGRITDQFGPVAGVHVFVKGTTHGTISDMDGNYSLSVSSNAILEFSFIGYLPVEIPVKDQQTINVVLKEDTQKIDEVVVVAYGTQKKVNLTAAVETVNTKVLNNRPAKTAAEMLEGVVSNLNISTTSGAPDASSSLNIRGFTGMDTKGSPLVLVDGVEQNLDFVNPNDIESISVLKDAAASAIYGSRAPYGVILITTKTGQRNTKTNIQYSGTFQVSQPSKLPSSMNSADFARLHNGTFRNSLTVGPYSESTIQKMQDYIDGKLDTYNEINSKGWWGEHFDAYANTDYYDYAFRKNAFNTTHDINITGGNNNSTYYAGLGYSSRQGIYNSDIDKYQRYNAILKLNTDITDWLSFNMNTRYVRQSTVRPNYRGAESSGSSDDTFFTNMAYYPNLPIKNPDGSWHRLSAMTMLSGEQGKMDKTIDDFWMTTGLVIKPLKGLTVKGNFSWNLRSALDDRTTYVVYVDQPNGEKPRSARSATIDNLWKKTFRSNYLTYDVTADYQKVFGKHDLSLLIGVQSEYKKNYNIIGSTSGVYTQSIPSFNLSWGDNMKLSDEINHWATLGTFFRASYNYDSRYLLDVNGRYDAASKYPSHSRWAFFPSVSAGWNIARESFWPIKQISMLKLTGTYGKLGDQSEGNYLYIPTMGTGSVGNMVLNGVIPKYVSNPGIVADNITWAKPQTIGFGVEVAAFNNRLRTEYYWYQRTVHDQLGPAETLPQTLGTTPPKTNNAVSETRGWDLTVSWRDQAFTILDSPVSYDVRFVMSDYVGYVVKYPNNTTGSRDSWTPGQVFGKLYGYEATGIATNKNQLAGVVLPGNGWYYTGDLMFSDLNGDGIIDGGSGSTWYSMGDLKELGFTYPRLKYSISLGLDWKNFFVSLLLDGVGKEVKYANTYSIFGATGSAESRQLTTEHQKLGYWSEANPDAFFPRAYTGGKNFDRTNSLYKINLAHLRVKNFNLGYNFPAYLTAKMKLNNLSVNFSMENLGFIYNKSWIDLDPQMIRKGGNGYPIQRTFSFGVKIGI